MRLFFGSISKTNKTKVDDHVIAEATAGFSSIFELNIFVEIPAPEPAIGRSQFFVSRGGEVREESPHFKGRNREAVCIKLMVEDYMKITDQSIRDLVPKYIVCFLVRATQNYVKRDLFSDVLKDVCTEEAKRGLLKADQGQEERIKELLTLKEATMTALAALEFTH